MCSRDELVTAFDTFEQTVARAAKSRDWDAWVEHYHPLPVRRRRGVATLYAKALDADFKKPILGDRFAKLVVERIGYDWKKTTIGGARGAAGGLAAVVRVGHVRKVAAPRQADGHGDGAGFISGQPVPISPLRV